MGFWFHKIINGFKKIEKYNFFFKKCFWCHFLDLETLKHFLDKNVCTELFHFTCSFVLKLKVNVCVKTKFLFL